MYHIHIHQITVLFDYEKLSWNTECLLHLEFSIIELGQSLKLKDISIVLF